MRTPKEFFRDLIGGCTEKVLSFFSSKWSILFFGVFSPIVSLIAFFVSVYKRVESYFNTMMDMGSDALGQVTSLNAGTMLGIANYFVPLDTMFACIAMLLSLYLVCLAYRFIKSWVPTVS